MFALQEGTQYHQKLTGHYRPRRNSQWVEMDEKAIQLSLFSLCKARKADTFQNINEEEKKWLKSSLRPCFLNRIWTIVQAAHLCLTLCDPTDCSSPGSSVHGTRILEYWSGTAISFSRGSSRPRDRTRVSCITGRFFTIWAPGKPMVDWKISLLSW